jgi:hypothetical protein
LLISVAFLVQRHQCTLGFDDFPLELYLPLPKCGSIRETNRSHANILQSLKRAKGLCERGDIGHFRFP